MPPAQPPTPFLMIAAAVRPPAPLPGRSSARAQSVRAASYARVLAIDTRLHPERADWFRAFGWGCVAAGSPVAHVASSGARLSFTVVGGALILSSIIRRRRRPSAS